MVGGLTHLQVPPLGYHGTTTYVREPTYITGSTIDHVYLRISMSIYAVLSLKTWA
jgi:hypothetical protein